MRAIRSSTHSSGIVASASLAMLLLFAAACGSDAPSANAGASADTAVSTQAATLSPEQLGELGAEIRREPARADEILARHQLTRESFEAAIRDVTEDAEASRRYAAAYRGASS